MNLLNKGIRKLCKSKAKRICKLIENKITSGEWKSGERMPTIVELSKKFDVSIVTVREGLHILQSKNLIKIKQGRGTYVNENIIRKTNTSPPHSSISALLDLMEVRQILEPVFAESAAKQAYKDEIELICQSANRMSKLAKNKENTIEEDLNFHLLIVQGTHNKIWIKMYEQLQNQLLKGRSHTNVYGMIEKACNYHHMISNSILKRDPENAKKYMSAHMESNRELILLKFTEWFPDQGIS